MGVEQVSGQWLQNYDPLGNLWLSGFVAILPIILFFVALVVFKAKGWLASLLTVILSMLIALFMYEMPFNMVIMSFIRGFLYGLWPIAWIIVAAIFLYKLSVKTGYFDVLKQSVMQITPDHRIQVVLIGFCFGSFLEGAIGFGGPVAITAALLVGLGLRPLYAAGLCLIANTAPVAFGAVGIPIIAMAGSVGVPADAISAMVGRMLPPLTIFVPFFIVFLMNGWRGVKETFPAIFVAAISFVLVQYFSSNYLGAELPDIISAIVSIFLTAIFLKFWKPKNIFRTDGDTSEAALSIGEKHHICKVIVAWLPFVFLIIVVVIWSTPWFKDLVKAGGALAATNISFHMPYIFDTILQNIPLVEAPKVINTTYTWNIISAAGTAILIAAIISIFALRARPSVVASSIAETFKEMWIPIITIGLVVSFAFVSQYSGAGATMGLALAQTGGVFTFFSPIVGWIGVFLTGSDTSANLLFGTLQQATAKGLGMPEVLFLAANSVGGVVGKMISPQSIAIACAAVGLVGRESELFRYAVKYSIGFVIVIGIWISLIAYVFPGMIPDIANYAH
ncbi:lactate permease LctP family transporter [Helicobacter sp. 11S02629-2]|uniref:lactate permease LctP family transporter n=1 Tax=Helicobacter sp. 11S02629-2 TaxID=1476195 RepID=UPI000BA61BEC|nr:lactate permease LctP family transporter [Helicobacter sp. 11S02629-2]PAF46020.1 L-lactate permease [Helicobacter sp. 11S02629-2]